MRGHTTLPMDAIDIHLLSDIIEHFFGKNKESPTLLQENLDSAQSTNKVTLPNEDVDVLLIDLSKIVERVDEQLEVSECVQYEPNDSVEGEFLDLSVYGYVKMRLDYFKEIHNPNR